MKWVLVIFLTIVGLFFLYLSNTELLYSEYWIQRKIIKTEQTQTDLKPSRKHLSYRFFYDNSIDLTIVLSDNGVVQLRHGNWLSADVVMNKELEFQLNPEVFEKLHDRFISHWKQSFTKGADYKLGRTYYELSLINPDNEDIEVNYYNVVPDDAFSNFKNQLMSLPTKP